MGLTDDLGPAYAELTGLLLTEESVETTLQRVADLATRVVDGCDACGVTLQRGDGRSGDGWITAASTDQLARDIDEAQYATGDGPCLDAIRHNRVNRVDDCRAEARWPAFAAEAEQRGIYSYLAVPLTVREQTIGALNLYSKQGNGFDRLDEEVIRLFSGAVAHTLANAQVFRSTASLVDQLKTAMESRAIIEQAKGVLVARHGVDPEAAFALLVEESQRNNRKLRDVATDLVSQASRIATEDSAR